MKSLSLCLPLAVLLFNTGCKSAPPKEVPAATTQSQPPQPAVTPVPTVSSGPANAAPTVDASGKVTTSSGLQYRVLASGPADGRSPSFFDSVMVHYRGTLTDGTVFDSSIERGVPATFGVGQVIAGWSEALRLMKPGDQWELFIPSRLAYGNRAVGDKIPPNSDLIFKVALLQVMSGS